MVKKRQDAKTGFDFGGPNADAAWLSGPWWDFFLVCTKALWGWFEGGLVNDLCVRGQKKVGKRYPHHIESLIQRPSRGPVWSVGFAMVSVGCCYCLNQLNCPRMMMASVLLWLVASFSTCPIDRSLASSSILTGSSRWWSSPLWARWRSFPRMCDCVPRSRGHSLVSPWYIVVWQWLYSSSPSLSDLTLNSNRCRRPRSPFRKWTTEKERKGLISCTFRGSNSGMQLGKERKGADSSPLNVKSGLEIYNEPEHTHGRRGNDKCAAQHKKKQLTLELMRCLSRSFSRWRSLLQRLSRLIASRCWRFVAFVSTEIWPLKTRWNIALRKFNRRTFFNLSKVNAKVKSKNY